MTSDQAPKRGRKCLAMFLILQPFNTYLAMFCNRGARHKGPHSYTVTEDAATYLRRVGTEIMGDRVFTDEVSVR